MKLTESQQAVVDCTEPDILVTAGAGSGKTSTTVRRYAKLLDREPEPFALREILVFTFTDKAAGELREKVREALREKAEADGEASPGAISTSDAWVGTFHAICNRILKAWPMEAGIDPGFSVLDSTSTETLMNSAFDRALSRFYEAEPARAELIGLFGARYLRDTVSYCYDELRSRGIERPRLPDFEDTGFPEKEIAGLRSLVDDALAGDLTGPRRAKLDDLCVLLDDGRYERLRFGSNLGVNARNNEALIAIEDAYRLLCEAMARHLADPVRREIAELLELYGEEFTAAKRARSALDYDDLQLTTLGLLKGNRHVRTAYRERFREIMVDEFQDTNGLQIELIKQLRGEKTTLTTVGDEMQSIYRFRHADVALFRNRRDATGVHKIELQENFRSQPEVIAAVNLIGGKLDDEVGRRRGGGVDRHRFSELEVGRSGSTASTALILTARAGWKPLDLGPLAPAVPPELESGPANDQFNEAEALAVAHHLRDLVEDRENGIQQGDIAILLRAKTRRDLYVSALRQAGLTPYVVSGGGFWKTREAVEVRALLSVIANPLDDNQLLGALTSPACGLSTDALWMLRQASRPYQPLWPALSALATGEVADLERPEWLSQLPADDREKGVRFVDTVESLRRRRAGLDLAGLVEAAVSETGYDLANLVRDPSADGIAAVRRVGSLAREYETAEGRSLRGFLDWSNLSEELDSEAAAATADEASDVVRIMTVHAAKGLQFKVTCVPDLGRDCGGKHDHAVRLGRSSARDPEEFKLGLRIPRFNGDKITAYDWEELAELERLANEDEELRLLHVAITRAEDHLVLSGILPEKPPGKGISHASPMIVRIAQEFGFDPRSPEEWKTKLGMAGDAGDGISVIHNIADEATAARLATVRPPVAVASETAPGEPPLSRPEAKVYPDVPLSFTAFSEFAECPARFYAKRVLRIDLPGEWARPSSPELEPMTGRSRGTRFGSAVHDVLEGLAKDGWREPSGDRISEALIHRGLGTGPGSEGDVELASRMITGFLGSELGQRVAAGKAAPEVPLIVRYEKVTIRGSADLILEGETPLVIDYKTNRLDGSSPGEKMKDYELQRGLYALALARARNLGAVDTAYVFLGAPEQPVFKTLGTDDFALIESLLKRTLAEITAGRFFGGPGAANQPCGEPDCIGCQVLTAQIERAAAEGR